MEINEDNKVNFRQAGRNQNGKLAKGPLQDPINKTTTSSIPYKFETILYKNTNPKGFGASSQRVLRSEDICPGPGSYDYEASRLRSNTASFSKKGYGNGFVSQANRMLYRGYINSGPGPGAYTSVAKPFQVTHIVHEQKKDPSEELLKSKSLQTDVPGPGYYNADAARTQNRLPLANSVFKSGTGRYNMTANSNPPPGTYEVDRALTDKKPFKHFMGSCNFMLPSKKKVSKTAEDKQNVDHLLGKDEAVVALGPGQYFKTDKEDELVLFNQKIQDKNSHTFLISNNTRFGEVIQRKVKRVENPGPGTYIPVTVGTEEKTLVSGAVFMSETARRPFKDVRNFVGPTKYNPELLPKKSYHLNINKMWV